MGSLIDSYHILGLTVWATDTEVKQAYKQLALLHHPDKAGPDSTKKFQEIQAAYEKINPKGGIEEEVPGQKPNPSYTAYGHWGSNAYKQWSQSRGTDPNSGTGDSGPQRRWTGSYTAYRSGADTKTQQANEKTSVPKEDDGKSVPDQIVPGLTRDDRSVRDWDFE